MLDEELTKITNSMQEKLGQDNSAMIADDFGMLISANRNTQEALKQAHDKIKSLEADKEKLVLANGNLLKQIPMESDTVSVKETSRDEPSQRISLSDAFDANGNFRH